jgi:hypothetical protein
MNKLVTINLILNTNINLHHSFLFNLEDLRKDRRMDPILSQTKEMEIISLIENNNHSTLK